MLYHIIDDDYVYFLTVKMTARYVELILSFIFPVFIQKQKTNISITHSDNILDGTFEDEEKTDNLGIEILCY